MATVNFINRTKSQSRAGLKAVLNYTMQSKKTEHNGICLVSGLNCTPSSVYQEFINTKLLYGKDDGRMYYHFVQSFPKDEVLSPETAHEIALKLAEHYTGFEVLVATHTDREHTHSHFIVNSVNCENGKKLHLSAKAIPEIRQKSDELCRQYGLSICKPKHNSNNIKSMTIGEYHLAVKGKNWKLQLANIIDQCMNYADSRETFIALMESEGVKVKWTDSRKNITYELADGKRCRDNKLYEEKYLKERMENELAVRQAIIFGRVEKQKFTTTSTLSNETRNADYPRKPTNNITGNEHDNQSTRVDNKQIFVARETDEQTTNTTGFDKNSRKHTSTTPETITGWETQRTVFFSSKNHITANRMDTNVYVNTHAIGSLSGDLLQLGVAMERATNNVNVAPTPQTRLDKKDLKKLIEKKQSKGQKHTGEDLQQDYDINMGGIK